VAEKKTDAPPSPAGLSGVLRPGTIKLTADEEPPPWRYPALLGGTALLGLVVLLIVHLVGRGAPPKPPTKHVPPEALAALDLDEVSGSALAKPVHLPGAGVMPGTKAARPGGVRARRAANPAAGIELPPAESGPKPRPTGAITYEPRGPGLSQ
jgi:hypothetical protein